VKAAVGRAKNDAFTCRVAVNSCAQAARLQKLMPMPKEVPVTPRSPTK
jgi:hypothetical protein